MKIKVFFLAFTLFTLFSISSYSQYDPYDDGNGLATVGVGFSSWGIPLFARYEHPVADNITVGGSVSYQSKSEKYSSSKWKHSIIGINGRGSYHFNELLEASDDWDFYGGASLGFYIWDTKYDGPGASFNYGGSGSGGLGIAAHVGARYFLNEKIALNLEVGGGSVLSGGTLGVTFIL